MTTPLSLAGGFGAAVLAIAAVTLPAAACELHQATAAPAAAHTDTVHVADAHGAAGDHYTVGDLTVTAPWARASAGMARAGAAFMTIENAGAGDRLIAASADVSARVELHTHTLSADGVMRMREVEGGIEIDANGQTHLEPGGLHVMFMGLEAPFEEGMRFPLTLTFEQAGDLAVEVEVRSPTAAGHGS